MGVALRVKSRQENSGKSRAKSNGMSNVAETRDRSNIGEDDVGSDTDVDLDLGLHKGVRLSYKAQNLYIFSVHITFFNFIIFFFSFIDI